MEANIRGIVIAVASASQSSGPSDPVNAPQKVLHCGIKNVEENKLIKSTRRQTDCTLIPDPGDRTPRRSGDYAEPSEVTGLKTFMSTVDGHIAAEAARVSKKHDGCHAGDGLGSQFNAD